MLVRFKLADEEMVINGDHVVNASLKAEEGSDLGVFTLDFVTGNRRVLEEVDVVGVRKILDMWEQEHLHRMGRNLGTELAL